MTAENCTNKERNILTFCTNKDLRKSNWSGKNDFCQKSGNLIVGQGKLCYYVHFCVLVKMMLKNDQQLSEQK